MFGKVMSISDPLMWRYWELLTNLPLADLQKMRGDVGAGTVHPMKAKSELAARIVNDFHGPEAAQEAAEQFARVHQRGACRGHADFRRQRGRRRTAARGRAGRGRTRPLEERSTASHEGWCCFARRQESYRGHGTRAGWARPIRSPLRKAPLLPATDYLQMIVVHPRFRHHHGSAASCHQGKIRKDPCPKAPWRIVNQSTKFPSCFA